ncbi:synaptotagmin-like protein 1 isoform X2 [Lepisosteus oculatus]|uniref:Synaptotagmin-like protein 1 n=1 Tax=Lepisosteus oculatus TaxID=7918 RepID=W5MBH5_LEPOC|nr:PREDICTED: synaptotagmin-like protein 1 isoform X2 [Lepisosteus oculatus]
MESVPSSDSLLDLSYLTEEEQASILNVLLRDSELHCLEEGRISKLRHTVSNPKELKSLTGEWFSEARSKRHRNRKYGSDIVRASIRRKKKPKAEKDEVGLSNCLLETPALPNGDIHTTAELKPLGTDKEGENHLSKDKMKQTSLEVGKHSTNEVSVVQEIPSDNSDQVSSSIQIGKSDQKHVLSDGSQLQIPTVSVQMDSPSEGDSDTLSSSAPLEHVRNPMRPSNSMSSLQSSTMLSGSMMSLFSSGEFGTLDVKGSVQFALRYDTQKEELQVLVCRCQDLAEAKKQRSDPYVKTYLLPDKSSHSKKKTSVKKKTVNPIFDETLKYKIKISEVKSRTLNLSVWHNDPLRRNIFLGEVEVAMATWDWTNTQPTWYDLSPRVQMTIDSISARGTIMLSLKFVPAGAEGNGMPLTGELHVWLKEAQGLIPTKGGSVDSFVKSYVLPDESKTSRQKTRVVKKTLSPTYNHTMVYDGFQVEDLQEACAEFTVWEHDTFSSQLLGGVRLSLGTGISYGVPVGWMDSTEEEKKSWRAMISQPNTWVEATLPLRTNLAPRNMGKEN